MSSHLNNAGYGRGVTDQSGGIAEGTADKAFFGMNPEFPAILTNSSASNILALNRRFSAKRPPLKPNGRVVCLATLNPKKEERIT
jgi:hypothetical protein